MLVSTIELEPAENNDDDDADNITVTTVNGQGETATVKLRAPNRGKTRGKVVSLRLEMAAYFQRSANQRASYGIYLVLADLETDGLSEVDAQ